MASAAFAAFRRQLLQPDHLPHGTGRSMVLPADHQYARALPVGRQHCPSSCRVVASPGLANPNAASVAVPRSLRWRGRCG